MVYWWVSYVFGVITREVIEDIQILKEVLDYHVSEYVESRYQKKMVRKLRSKMSSAVSYEEWSVYSQQQDNLKSA